MKERLASRAGRRGVERGQNQVGVPQCPSATVQVTCTHGAGGVGGVPSLVGHCSSLVHAGRQTLVVKPVVHLRPSAQSAVVVQPLVQIERVSALAMNAEAAHSVASDVQSSLESQVPPTGT